MRVIASALLVLALSPNLLFGSTLTFDDLSNEPGVSSQSGFVVANGGATYSGVTFSDHFTVVGDDYRVDTATPGPAYGLPHSGHYLITNTGGLDGILISTDQVLVSSFWAQNEYYGSGGGADQITITALHNGTELAHVVLDLPAGDGSAPTAMQELDSSVFATLTGITGYRIDRHEPRDFHNNWVADDFTFVAPAQVVPEPSSVALLAFGLLTLAGAKFRRRQPGKLTAAAK